MFYLLERTGSLDPAPSGIYNADSNYFHRFRILSMLGSPAYMDRKVYLNAIQAKQALDIDTLKQACLDSFTHTKNALEQLTKSDGISSQSDVKKEYLMMYKVCLSNIIALNNWSSDCKYQLKYTIHCFYPFLLKK